MKKQFAQMAPIYYALIKVDNVKCYLELKNYKIGDLKQVKNMAYKLKSQVINHFERIDKYGDGDDLLPLAYSFKNGLDPHGEWQEKITAGAIKGLEDYHDFTKEEALEWVKNNLIFQ